MEQYIPSTLVATVFASLKEYKTFYTTPNLFSKISNEMCLNY